MGFNSGFKGLIYIERTYKDEVHTNAKFICRKTVL